METIKFYLLPHQHQQEALTYHHIFANDLIIYRHHTFYLKNYFLESIEEDQEIEGIEQMDDLKPIKYHFAHLEINKIFQQNLEIILIKAIEQVAKMTETKLKIESIYQKIWVLVKNILTQYQNDKKTHNKDIFDLFTDFFIAILVFDLPKINIQVIALAFLKGLMWEYGYYLKWSWMMEKHHLTHKVLGSKFLTILKASTHPEKIQVKTEIKYWIMKHTKIALYLRKD